MPPAADDDEHARTLLQRCARGDERALSDLYRLMAHRIHAFARHRLDDDDQATSVVVDTLHEVWRNAARFRGDSRVSTWVLGIARFKALAQLRARLPPMDDIEDHAERLPAEGLGGADGEALLARWQETLIVQRCLASGAGLSPEQRQCLQLVHVEGLPLAEVAQVQQVPQNTVKTRLFHARRKMRECLMRPMGDGPADAAPRREL